MPGAILRSRVTDEIERAPAGLQDWPDDIIASDNELKKHGKYVWRRFGRSWMKRRACKAQNHLFSCVT
ncbi:hypothetical protein HBH98_243170 [Parastagonospora nodorum]|nr:hypothetical protein HBH51_242740 [Parastagonospora nodorum]KAH4334335.1 hypothetical protein HBH98_243170 [Parastagonospora nodorum]KAH4355302.1 hypothetical protein HBH97_238860 [Parastagonospora nodorum]KAH4368794.1 hypothetical protein HBH99_244890 [Parastagonospora nodorum]KAH4891265.1 hypothetical protein HBH74_227360 [Parastagonospora nodorum]